MSSSPKGQVEVILELCDNSIEASSELEVNEDPGRYNRSLNPFESGDEPTTSSKSRFSLSDVRFPNVKRLMKGKREKQANGLCLKITTSKMRCSIKVKEEFENDASKNLWYLKTHSVHVIHNLLAAQIYLKTTVFEHGILSGSWRSEQFSPTLSTRFDPVDSTVIIPLVNEDCIENVSLKTTIATKTKLGKKIILGTIYIRPDLDSSLEQWTTMIVSRNTPVPTWYSFE